MLFPCIPDLHAIRQSLVRHTPTAIVLLSMASACFGLAACSGSSDPSSAQKAPTPQEIEIYNHHRAELLELVACARRHGIPLPDPTPSNKVNTAGVNLRGHRRKAALNTCYQKVVKKSDEEFEFERETREASQKRLGETQLAGPQKSAQGAAFQRERAQLMEVVRCARHHGIPLPAPDAHNNINTSKISLTSPHNKPIMNACFHEVVSKATGARQTGSQRSGEAPTP